jgi:HD-GYP domain-containing protein (c-di-GMP phosphodiesterase class II)
MTSERSYRESLATAHALAEILRCAGSQFDPELAKSFVEACDSGALDPGTRFDAFAIEA